MAHLKVRIERRWWVSPAFEALVIACAMTDFASPRLARTLSDWGTTLIARHGFKIHAN